MVNPGQAVTFEDVRAALTAVQTRLPATPAWNYPILDAKAKATVVVKHENVQPTGAFKVRGGVNLAARLAVEPAAGLVTASTGNHAQSVAYAGRISGTRTVIVMPTNAPVSKIEATRRQGAEVLLHGQSMADALVRAAELAASDDLRFIDPGNDPDILAGHATVYLELLDQYPDLEAIYVPIGSGTGAAGACIVRDEVAPACRIVGVQAAAAPAAYNSWKDGSIQTAPAGTAFSGLATSRGFERPQAILRARLDDFRLVSEDAIRAAIRLLATAAHTLAEGAAAASLAGLMSDAGRPGRCAIVCTGGNADTNELASICDAAPVQGTGAASSRAGW